MSVVVSCICGRQFQADPQLYGRRVSCPSCGGMIQVPSPQHPTSGASGLTPINPPAQTTSAASPYGLQAAAPNPFAEPKPVQPNVYDASLATSTSSPNYQYKRRSGIPVVFIVLIVAVGLILLLGVGASIVAYRAVSTFQALADGTNLEARDEDFASAFRSFKTKLVSNGPAPQDWDPLSTPAGAVKLSYRSQRDRRQFTAYVDPDPGDGDKHPAVIFLHGGFAFGEEDWSMPSPFRDAGYVVMMPVLRAENGQKGAFTLYHHEVDDVRGALAALQELPYVDPSRIYITGHSAGGTLAALVSMISPDIRAASSLCGCMDQTLNADIAPYPSSDIDEVAIRSPVAYAASFKCPTRLFYGHAEYLLQGANEATAERAAAAGLDVKTSIVAGDHFTAVPEAIQKTLVFFQQQGGPASAYSPGNVFERTSPSPTVRPPSYARPSYTPPTYTPPTYTPPTYTPPTYTPPTYTPPRLPSRISPPTGNIPQVPRPTIPQLGPAGTPPNRVGPSRVGPSRVGPSIPQPGSGFPNRVGPSNSFNRGGARSPTGPSSPF